MLRWLTLLMIALAATAGCSRPSPEAPQATSQAPIVTPQLARVTGTPIDWYDGDPNPSAPPLTDNACTVGPESGLEYRGQDGYWRPHPLSDGKFYVPSAVVVICNGSTRPMEAQRIMISGASSSVQIPPLQPGQAVGPLRLFTDRGLPATHLAFLKETTLELESMRLPILPTTDPSRPEPSSEKELAWAEAGDFYLYAPNATYTIQSAPWCGAAQGYINASADTWRLYHKDLGLLLEIGPREFPGGRGMEAVDVPQLGTTFLFLADYASCANPTWYAVYAYDQTTRSAYRPQMQRADGRVNAATVVQYTVTPDGTLTSKSYSNAGDVGWHTDTYTWNAASRTWVHAQP